MSVENSEAIANSDGVSIRLFIKAVMGKLLSFKKNFEKNGDWDRFSGN